MTSGMLLISDRHDGCATYQLWELSRHRPFFDLVNDNLNGIIRSKGSFWLASVNDYALSFQQAGELLSYAVEGKWLAAAIKENPSLESEYADYMEETFDGIYGDRKQELVFIGIDLKKEEIIAKLDQCLLSDEEFAQGPECWSTFESPFEIDLQMAEEESPELAETH